MPQIVIISQFLHKEVLARLGCLLVSVVEKGFGIEGKNDTACTVINDVFTINEASIQIEIRYTAGEDEYDWGRPFDPTMEEQSVLTEAIKPVVDAFLAEKCDGLCLSLSVWCKPFYNSHFKMWKKKQ
jgi:hypothetical protein